MEETGRGRPERSGSGRGRGRGRGRSGRGRGRGRGGNGTKRQDTNGSNNTGPDAVEVEVAVAVAVESAVPKNDINTAIRTAVSDTELNRNAAEFVPLIQSLEKVHIEEGETVMESAVTDGTDKDGVNRPKKNDRKKKTNSNQKRKEKKKQDRTLPSSTKQSQEKEEEEEAVSNQEASKTNHNHEKKVNNDDEKAVHGNIDENDETKVQEKTDDKKKRKKKSQTKKTFETKSEGLEDTVITEVKDTSTKPRDETKKEEKKERTVDATQSTANPIKTKKDVKKRKETKAESKKSQNITMVSSVPPHQPQTTNDLNYKRGEKITILHIAEKPSIATSIAKGLCRGNFSTLSKSLPVHEFTTTESFPKAPHATKCLHKITSVAGHVFNVDFPSSYQSWDNIDPADLFHAPIVKKACKGSVVRHLSDTAKGVDFIVLWLDCDREGENICQEVLGVVQGKMADSNHQPYDRVYRAYFSAINPSDIQKAYHALGKPDINQSLSVDARQELDLKVGVAFSRFQTRYFQGRYGDLDSAVLSYGPCQTPCLGFCVKRHIDIETFKPEPYWLLDLGVVKRGRIIRAQWNSGRSFNQAKVQQLINSCMEQSGTCEVTNVVSKEKKQGRPVPLNTVNLLKACSKALGIGPHAAMQTAERLYLSGYLSYPRTESTAYPKSFDIKGTLQSQSGDPRWGDYVSNLLKNGNCKARGGVDMGDHPPITPCRPAGPHELSGDMARVYELVTRHFIASVSQDAVWNNTRVDLSIKALADKGLFTIRGKQLISPGFLAVLLHKEYGDEQDEDDLKGYTIEDEVAEVENLPDFSVGESFEISSSNSTSVSGAGNVNIVTTGSRATLNLKEKMTTAPGYLTESELIGQMEKNGIGTDASIATHIENILKRNYVELAQGRRLIPTKLGLVLAQGYHLIDSSLVLPKVRADIEGQCNKIAKGQADKDSVLKTSIDIFSKKFANFVNDIAKMDVLFSSSFAKLEDVGKPFTRCGITRRYLQFITGPPPRLYNRFTESVYPLPVGGNIKEWSGRKCNADGCDFELCLYSVGQPERSFPLCPFCFNNPRPEWGLIPGTNQEAAEDDVEREDENKERSIKSMGGRQFILECPLPDGHPLIEELTVGPDPDSDGVITLDPTNPNKLRLVSTRGPTIFYLPKTIDKFVVLDKRDEETNDRLVRVEFKPGQSPLPDGELKYTTCFSKDEILKNMIRVYHGSERTQGGGRGRGGRGGRGRGNGRGGRGRGGKGRGGRGRF